ncbi:SDR family NAD(P)-dependent oxidoreductase [Kocuria rosea]|uniref:SDR family NAD(P)-dependent oxidoreductase n=1 Tax=Kocuria rosea TaxID=1275 RepID=UPI00203C5287|nr:SDR family NAD(P)-dependent oxidoreductase [Kocuria rosea]MCM3687546.1 SDR family NAD(P)-dependent oxidoreductase [Kocuria rosea]
MSPSAPFRFPGATAVLTGAASGIGEHLARGLAARGTHLVLLDRDAAGLDGVAASIRERHPQVRLRTVVVDLAELSSLPAVAERVLAEHPRIDLLVNNAGVALGGRFDQVSAEEFDWVMDVNFRAPVALTRLFLPALLRAPGGHLVNVSSLFGLVAPPGQVAYSSSKFALRGFTEGLRHELAGRVGVTVVHPGGVRTRIAESARRPATVPEDRARADRESFAALLGYPPERAAAEILGAVEKRRGRLLVAPTAVLPAALARLLPGSYWPVLHALTPVLQAVPRGFPGRRRRA